MYAGKGDPPTDITSNFAEDEPECASVDCVTVVATVGILKTVHSSGEPLVQVSKFALGISWEYAKNEIKNIKIELCKILYIVFL